MTNNDTMLRSTATTAAAVAVVLLLAGCNGHKKDATQSAARVDGTEITVHQINYKLQRDRSVRPGQQEEAGRKVLEQLIDEQLIVEKAEKTKLDMQPEAQQALEAARRDVLSRAYVETAAQSVTPPTDAALHAYYDANPLLLSQRRIYTLQEYLAKVPEDKIPTLRTMVEGGRPPEEVEAWFKAQGAAFRGQESTQPAERIPNALKEISAIPVGHGIVASAGTQVHVTYVVSSTDASLTFDKARQGIGQYLVMEGRKKVADGNLAALRTAAKIDYAPQYAALAASGAALATTKDLESTATPLSTASGTRVSLPAANEASGVQVTLPTTTSSSVQVTLPQSQGVRVSLPATPASSVPVRLPANAPQDATKK